MNTQNKHIKIFEDLAKEKNLTFEYSFKSNVGRFFPTQNHIKTSKPINPERLQVGLHEIGHHVNRKVSPNYLQEYLCDMFSFEIMKQHNIPIKKKVKERSKKYIAIKVQMAINRGLKTINPKVKDYIKKDYPQVARLEKGFI